MIGVGNALIKEIAQGPEMSRNSCGHDRWSQFHLCHSHVEEASLLTGQTQVCMLWHSHGINYLATYLCVPSTSTKVFFKDVVKGLTLKLYELREKDQNTTKERMGGHG